MISEYKKSTNGHQTSESELDSENNQSSLTKLNLEQEFKIWRRDLSAITKQMYSAHDADALMQVTTAAIRKKLECDRALIFRFQTSEKGTAIAESMTKGWTPTMGETLSAIVFGMNAKEEYLEPFTIDDVKSVELTPYQEQLLEKFQVQSSLSIPIVLAEKVWGLLVLHNCSQPRQWLESEISFGYQIAGEISQRMQSFEFQQQLLQQRQEYKSLSKVIDKIQRASNLDKIFQTTTQEVRQLIKCDRVAVYRFGPDWSGEFISESVAPSWVRLVGPGIKTVWEDTHLQETQGGRYRHHENFVINDIYQAGHSPCHVEILEQFQVRAYLIVPVFSGSKLWGLLAAYQNNGPYEWHSWQINFNEQIAAQFGIAVSQAEYIQRSQEQSEKLAKTNQRQQNVIILTRKIGEALTQKATDSSQFEVILQITVSEVRRLLQTDRTVVYRFNPDWSGEFIAESMGTGWKPFREKDIDPELLQENGHCDSIRSLESIYKDRDTHLQDTRGGRYQQKTSFTVDDVELENFPRCYTELLEQFEAKAYLTVPIFKENKLWGLLASYQHSRTRHWEDFEVSAMEQIAVLLGVAIGQAETVDKLQQQSEKIALTAEGDRARAKVIDKIRQSLDIESIFFTTTKEVRSLLGADRVAVYRLNPDYSGDFVSESFGSGWLPLMERQKQIPRLLESINSCDRMRTLFRDQTTSADPYILNTQSALSNNQTYVVDDIYSKGFHDCYIEVLEQYQCRAYAIVPIFQAQKLWGMLAAYQNDGPRQWEAASVNLLTQIATQLGVALQQAEYLQQLQAQSQQLKRSAEQKQLVSKIIERIRQSTNLETLFTSTAREVRGLLKADRVGVFRFCLDGSFDEGEFVAEDVLPPYVSVLQGRVKDYCFSEQYASDYQQGRIQAVTDIYDAGFTDCHVQILANLQIRANLLVPLIKGKDLWGFLCVHQCSEPREWQEMEIDLVKQIADQFGVVLQQAEYLQQLQDRSAQLAKAAARDKEAREYLQKGVMKLLRAVRPALDGDLTVRAPITEDELGTIADAYNNTIQALRQIVIQVQVAAQKVADTSSSSDASVQELTNSAQQQSKEIAEALSEIQQMVESTQAVVNNTESVQAAVQKANKTVESGDVAMNHTVEAIEAIRETVAQTSKKIKRLSESSQKISKVVNLISNFATQTNVLALNAAIEATRAGEYGKGFAVVADEVRSLSRQSATATIEIEKLVHEIQLETGEVAVAMETGIQQVVEGTNFVSETRRNLNHIVTATAEISQLLSEITHATQTQMLQSVSVTTSMKDVAQIANKTFAETNNITVVFQQLSEMAQELLASASKFKVN